MFKYCVFFDVDETLLKVKSMLEVFDFYHSLLGLDPSDFTKLKEEVMSHGGTRADLNKFFYSKFKGVSSEKMKKACFLWFESNKEKLFFPNILLELEKHIKKNALVVLVTGSFYECIEIIAEYVGVKKIICAKLKIIDGLYTGELLEGPIIGDAKAKAINEFIAVNNLSLVGSYAYADDDSDIPMLELVDSPIVVGNNKTLISYAHSKKWSIFKI